MQLYQVLRSGKSIDHQKAWTLCVLGRPVIRQIEERSRFVPLDEVEIAQHWLGDAGDAAAIQNLLQLLSPREQEVLLLRLEAMKYREIADHLGISMSSVNTLSTRALQKLNKAVYAKLPMKDKKGQYEKKPVKRAS